MQEEISFLPVLQHSSVESSKATTSVPVLYRYRWVILTVYSFGAALNQICWISLQPVAGVLTNAYGISNELIASISLIYMAIFILFVFPANIILEKGGLKLGVLSGILLTAIGMWIKCLVNHGFGWVFIGQFIAAIGQPLLGCAGAKMAAFWFGENERVIAITIGTVAQPIGVAIGYVFPAFFVTTDDSLPENVSKARIDVYHSLFWQAIIGTFVALIAVILFREKPLTPPSRAQSHPSESIIKGIKNVWSNQNCRRLTIVFGLILGIMNTLGTAIGIITAQYNYSANQASLFGAVFIIGGIFGSGVFGTIVEIKKTYKICTQVISTLTAITPIALLFSLKSMSIIWTSVSCFIVGFASVSILPVGIDFAVELSHPIPEPISSGLIMSCGQFFGIVLTVIVSLLVTKKGNAGIIWGQIMMIFGATLAAVISFSIKEDLRRLNEQKQFKKISEVSSEEEIMKSELIM